MIKLGSVNWSDLQRAAGDAGFDPLPPSTYDVIVDEASATQSSNGKDMIKVTFRVEGGPHDTRKIFNNFVISPDSANGLAFFFRHMAVLGLKDDFFANNPTTEMVAAAIVSRRCRVKVSIRQWQEQDRNQVDAVLPPAANVGPAVAPTVSPVTPIASTVTGPAVTINPSITSATPVSPTVPIVTTTIPTVSVPVVTDSLPPAPDLPF